MKLLNLILKILGFRLRGNLNAIKPIPASINEVLPAEILTNIAAYLELTDLANLKLVSHHFHALSHDALDIAWQPYLEKLKEIDPTISLIPPQGHTISDWRQARFKEHFIRISQEQFEEIQVWRDASNAPMRGSKLNEITGPAKTFGEIQRREQLLNELNANLIKLKIFKQRKILELEKTGLTRFPKELFEDVEYMSYWSSLTELNLSNNFIKCLPDALGASCTALQNFSCQKNMLTALPDLSNCIALKELDCSDNKLTALPDLSNCTVLQFFYCESNSLTTLPDLSKCIALTRLNCSRNNLTTLPDFSKCTALLSFNCRSNSLTTLPDLSKCNALNIVYCSNNKLTALPDLSKCTALLIIDYSYNELSALPHFREHFHSDETVLIEINCLKTIPDDRRARFKEDGHKSTMASQRNLFLTNMVKYLSKGIKVSQSHLKAIVKNCVTQFIEMVKAPSDHPLKVGLLSALLFAVCSMCFVSSSGLLAPSILLGGLVTMGIKTKNHFANKALHRAEQQPNSHSVAVPVSAGEKRNSNWYQYAQGLYTPVLFAAGNQRVENVGAQPENTSTVNAALKP